MKDNLFKKFIEFGIGSFAGLILGFISSPIITRLVSPEEFGKFSMFNTITNLMMFLITLGIDQAYVRYFYEEDLHNRGMLLKKSIKLPIIFNIVISIFILVFYKIISQFIIGRYSISIILMVIIQNTFNVLGRFSLLTVRLQQKGKLYSLLQVITKISYILSVIFLSVIFNKGYNTLIVATVLSNIIVVIISIWSEKDIWFSKINLNYKVNVSQKELINFGVPLVFSTAITLVFQSMDKIFLNIFSGYTQLGLYSSAFSIVALLNAMQAAFTTFWVPVANEQYINEPNNTRFFTQINSYVSYIMLIMCVGLITFKDILIILLGEKYRGASFIFPFLVFIPLMYTVSETTVLGINFKKKTKYHIIIATVCTGFNLIGNLILVPKYGAIGSAISTGISYIIFFVLRTVISQKLYKVKYNVLKFGISTISVIILSFYASFNKFNLYLLLIGIISFIIINIAYRNVIIEIFSKINIFLKKRV